VTNYKLDNNYSYYFASTNACVGSLFRVVNTETTKWTWRPEFNLWHRHCIGSSPERPDRIQSPQSAYTVGYRKLSPQAMKENSLASSIWSRWENYRNHSANQCARCAAQLISAKQLQMA